MQNQAQMQMQNQSEIEQIASAGANMINQAV
jgi:hypothetical protein